MEKAAEEVKASKAQAKAEKEAEKAAKAQAKAEKEAEKAAKAQAKEDAKKAAEEAKASKAQSKLDKAAEKAAKALAKEEAKKAPKVAKEKAPKAPKVAKEKAPKKTAKVVADVEADVVKKIEVDGKKYLKSKATGVIYDYEVYVSTSEQVVVGKWNEASKSIDFEKTDEECEEEYEA